MDTQIQAGLLSRLTDWHAFTLDIAGDLARAGHLELAQSVEHGAAETLMGLLRAAGAISEKSRTGPSDDEGAGS